MGELTPANVCENDENPEVEEDVSSDEPKEHPSSNEFEACFSARNLFKREIATNSMSPPYVSGR